MRVLMLSWEYPPHVVGGLGEHVAALAPALARQGIEVTLVTPRWAGGESFERRDAVYVHRVDPPDFSKTSDVYETAQYSNHLLEEKAAQLVREQGLFDIIHGHDWLVSFSAMALKNALKIPLVASIHATERGRGRGSLSGDMPWAINDAEWHLTYEAWRIISCSRFMMDEIVNYFNVPADKVDVIPNGVDANRFSRWDGIDLSSFRSDYALPSEKLVFHVGRMVQEKGAHLLVQAIPRVLEAVPLTKFVIAGTGPLLGELRRLAWELGVSSQVLFTGFIPDEDRDRLLKLAECAAFPSLYEPFGIVALEAMAAKAPLVVSRTGGFAEIVVHAETGITVYPDNVESLAWGIVHTLEHPEWAQQRVANAYQKVLTEYNWDRIAQLTIQVYERIAGERKKVSW